jgi:hypothetical protein
MSTSPPPRPLQPCLCCGNVRPASNLCMTDGAQTYHRVSGNSPHPPSCLLVKGPPLTPPPPLQAVSVWRQHGARAPAVPAAVAGAAARGPGPVGECGLQLRGVQGALPPARARAPQPHPGGALQLRLPGLLRRVCHHPSYAGGHGCALLPLRLLAERGERNRDPH